MYFRPLPELVHAQFSFLQQEVAGGHDGTAAGNTSAAAGLSGKESTENLEERVETLEKQLHLVQAVLEGKEATDPAKSLIKKESDASTGAEKALALSSLKAAPTGVCATCTPLFMMHEPRSAQTQTRMCAGTDACTRTRSEFQCLTPEELMQLV